MISCNESHTSQFLFPSESGVNYFSIFENTLTWFSNVCFRCQKRAFVALLLINLLGSSMLVWWLSFIKLWRYDIFGAMKVKILNIFLKWSLCQIIHLFAMNTKWLLLFQECMLWIIVTICFRLPFFCGRIPMAKLLNCWSTASQQKQLRNPRLSFIGYLHH